MKLTYCLNLCLMSKATSAPKKAASKSSAGANPVFEELKGLFAKHVPPLVVLSNQAGRFELVTSKPYLIKGIRKDNAYFGAVMEKKGFIGLYLMFIYEAPEKLERFGPELIKLLKGKSCFHVKKLDENLKEQIADALEEGMAYYRAAGAI